MGAMNAKPMAMGSRSIRAWQAGMKHETRRLVRPLGLAPNATGVIGPAYSIGTIVWFREALQANPIPGDDGMFYDREIVYQADGLLASQRVWDWQRDVLPAIFMPRWACRYYARITSFRSERLHEMRDVDAVAEGVLVDLDGEESVLRYPGEWVEHYADWWDELHKKRGTRWMDNPWVWVYGLERMPENDPH